MLSHAQDPDFHDGRSTSAPAWFVTFMRRYITRAQLVRQACIATFLHFVLGAPVFNLALFWAAPSITSAMQLWFFGTYLPHRERHGQPYVDRHRARSVGDSTALSLLTCYNFGGCHWEHHAYAAVPWWRLHVLRAALQCAVDK